MPFRPVKKKEREALISQLPPLASLDTINEGPLYPNLSTNYDCDMHPLILHLLEREFFYFNPSLTSITDFSNNFPNYLESRLLQLYPGTYSAGDLANCISEYESNMNKINSYMDSLDEFHSSDTAYTPYHDNFNPLDQYSTVPTIAQFADSMNLSVDEEKLLDDAETLATNGDTLNFSQIDSFITANEGIGKASGVFLSYLTAGIAGVSYYTFYKAYQSRQRAFKKPIHFMVLVE